MELNIQIDRINRGLLKLAMLICTCCLGTALFSQKYTINTYTTSTIYPGTANVLKWKTDKCSSIRFEVEPKIRTKHQDCEIKLWPSGVSKYSVKVFEDNIMIDSIELQSSILQVKLGLIADGKILSGQKNMSRELATELTGVDMIVNCPWERKSCRIYQFTFIIIPIRGENFIEKVMGSEFNSVIKDKLSKVEHGDKVYIEDINYKCPGDGHWPPKELNFSIN